MDNETERDQSAVPEPSGESAVVGLGSTLDITVAADMHQRLRRVLEPNSAVSLDAGELERVDAAGLQVLAAFAEQARGEHVRVQWLAVSPCLEEAALLTGLAGCLGLSSAVA
ncbi:MAG: STAS domain-containing protein [Gammaproteobacteria bacterium]